MTSGEIPGERSHDSLLSDEDRLIANAIQARREARGNVFASGVLQELGEVIDEDPEVVRPLDTTEPDIDDFGDSSEDELRIISGAIRERFSAFGITGLHSVENDHPKIIQLWGELELSHYLVDDLTLYSTVMKQKFLKSPFVKPTIDELIQDGELFTNPYSIRVKLVEEVVPNLVDLGFNKRKVYKLSQRGAETRTGAVRFMGWLAGQEFMSDFPQVLDSARRSGSGLRLSKLTTMAMEEMDRQERILESSAQTDEFDLNIGYQRSAYVQGLRTIREAKAMSRLVFLNK